MVFPVERDLVHSMHELSSGQSWPTILRSRVFLWVIIPLLWALAYLPQLGVRDLRLEEGRRAQPALEMLRSGDFITPRLYGEPYLNKPPLFFWVVAVNAKVQGEINNLTTRIPSVLAVLGGWFLVLLFAGNELSILTLDVVVVS